MGLRVVIEWYRAGVRRRREITGLVDAFERLSSDSLAADLEYVAYQRLGPHADVADGTVALLLAAAKRLRDDAQGTAR